MTMTKTITLITDLISKVYRKCKYTGDFVFYVDNNIIYMDWEGNDSWGPYEENEEFSGTEVYLLSCTPDNGIKEEISLSWIYGCSKVICHQCNPYDEDEDEDDEKYEVIIPYNNGCKDGFTERKWVDGEWKKDFIKDG